MPLGKTFARIDRWRSREKGPNSSASGAFTLIELLIVIAIILILIAIALPNFLEAQLRSRVARTRADLRTISVALHSYYLDWGIFTADHDPNENEASANGLNQLTSPVPYLSEIPHDTFSDPSSGLGDQRDEFTFEMGSTGIRPRALAFGFRPPFNIHAFVVYSYGPDNFDNFLENDRWPFPKTISGCGEVFSTSYTPTNGTRSLGDIMEFGGEYRNGRYCVDDQIIAGRGSDYILTVPE